MVATIAAMSSIFQVKHNGRVQWCIKWKQAGSWRFVYDDSKTRVQAKQLARIAQLGAPAVERSKPVSKPENDKKNPTLNALFSEHVEHADYKQTTYTLHTHAWKALEVNIGNKRIKQLTRDDIQEAFDMLNAAPYTALTRWRLINACINDAIKRGIITRNINIDKPKVVNRTRILDNRNMSEYTDTITLILKWLEDKDCKWHEWYALVRMLNLGLRISEALAITEEQADLESFKYHSLTIDKQLTKDGRIAAGTKGRKGSYNQRTIPLPDLYFDALKEHIEYNHKHGLECLMTYKPDGIHETTQHLVFINRRTGKPIRYNTFRNAWIQIQQEWCRKYNNRELKDTEYIKPHTNRHITATLLAQSHVSVLEAQAILGHMDARMTEYYTHLQGEALREAAERIEYAMDGTGFAGIAAEVVKSYKETEPSENS